MLLKRNAIERRGVLVDAWGEASHRVSRVSALSTGLSCCVVPRHVVVAKYVKPVCKSHQNFALSLNPNGALIVLEVRRVCRLVWLSW